MTPLWRSPNEALVQGHEVAEPGKVTSRAITIVCLKSSSSNEPRLTQSPSLREPGSAEFR